MYKANGGYLVLSKLSIMHVLNPISFLNPPVDLLVEHTLYQCFLTDPSVLVGKVYTSFLAYESYPGYTVGLTLAISAQLLPASRICFSRNSSCGVQGVLVRLFLAGGGATGAAFASSV